MAIKNVTAADLVLVELLNGGSTEAPSELIRQLNAKGLVILTHGKPSLSGGGKRRAKALRPNEHDLRRQFAAGGAGGGHPPILTVGGSGITG